MNEWTNEWIASETTWFLIAKMVINIYASRVISEMTRPLKANSGE